MTSRDAILRAIRAADVPPAPPVTYPVLPPTADSRDLLRERFLRVLREVGGDGALQTDGQTLDALLEAVLGDDRSHAMVLRGRMAVAENAAVYVDAADLARRNDIVRETHLVLVVPMDAIVATMHEAVRVIPTDAGCGWFLSGPSKTADIEQSLVFGAQGSRVHRVIFAR